MTNSLWLITDGKPGHRAQLRGLAERLGTLSRVAPVWIHTNDCRLPWWRTRPRPLPDVAAPALIIGAGRRTHRLLLALSRQYRVPAVVLMRPARPLWQFDAAIIPAHDRPPKRDTILVTEGVLNDVHPVTELTRDKSGLILVGGHSRHYRWEELSIHEQILAITDQYPDWQWLTCDSRRTPESLLESLRDDAPENLQLHPHTDTPEGWVRDRLSRSRTVWVTPDSVSMVFEALTAGVPTGLLSLPVKRKGRIPETMQRLIDTGHVTAWPKAPESANPPPRLWEADRAARWLIQRFPDQLPPRDDC